MKMMMEEEEEKQQHWVLWTQLLINVKRIGSEQQMGGGDIQLLLVR